MAKTKVMTAIAFAKLTKPGMHLAGGVPGLYLKIGETGSRSWVLRATFKNRRIDRGLGSASILGLADAREKARDLLKAFAEGRDPKEEKAAAAAVMTFAEAMNSVAALKEVGWKGNKAGENWKASMERYAIPVIGKLPVNEIGQTHMLRILSPIWVEKHATAALLRSRIESVLDYATARGHRVGDNPARLKLLAFLLPNAQPATIHRAAMPWAEVPALMTKLSELTGAAPLALRFIILNASRATEVRELPRAGEIDMEAAVWTIPAARMKTAKEHVLPLTPAALEIVKEAQALGGGPFMFPGNARNRPLSFMTLTRLLRLFEVDESVHGMRSAFRDWAGEHGYDRELAEEQLSHARGNAVERAYSRSKLLARRRVMMEAWADYVLGEAAGQVIAFPSASNG